MGKQKAAGIKSQYDLNKEIEAMLDERGDDPRAYSSKEKEFLMLYSGYGGVKDERISAAEAKGSFSEFYTPDTIVKKMWDLAYKHGYSGGSICEPAVGIGNFLRFAPVGAHATGYEISPYSYKICKILFPQQTFYNQHFEKVFIHNNNSIRDKVAGLPKYSLVIGNPPFGTVGGLYMGMGEKAYSRAANYTEYFIFRGLDLLAPGGLLVFIVGVEVANGGVPWLQQGTSKIKEAIAKKSELLEAYRLPNGVFERTDVLTDIVVFRKNQP